MMQPHPAALAFPAPAKLNLDLRIIGRRADGYHLLESIFCLIDLCDTIWLLPREDGQIILHNPAGGIPPEQDLSHRAARLLQQFSGSPNGVDIWQDKHIPSGGARMPLPCCLSSIICGIPPCRPKRCGRSA